MNAATADVFKIIACIDGSTKGDLHLGQHELLIWKTHVSAHTVIHF